MKFKFCLSFLLLVIIFSNIKSVIGIKANSEQVNDLSTNLSDFDILSMNTVVYFQDDDYKVGYLLEGVTPSYMIYDHINGAILLYCYDSHSPWYLYPSSFENYGRLYLGGDLYCYINVETSETHLKGEIEVINQDINIESNSLVADLFYIEIYEPNLSNFGQLFDNNIIESYIINDAWYFERLNSNIGINENNSCQYVALNMFLSYYDTFYDDNIVPDEYIIETNIINKNNFDMVIESPGGGQLLDSHLKDLMDDSGISNTTDILYFSILENYCTAHNYDINEMFELICVDDYQWIDPEFINLGYIDVIEALDQDLPVFLGVYCFSYYDNESGEIIHVNYDGHAIIAYGYYITNKEANGKDTSIYYLSNMGFYDEFHQYKYSKTLVSTLNRGASEGFVLKPNDNYHHICSNSYIYTVGDCELGLCPCDQYLNDNEFYAKYCNLIVTEGYDEFYCKEHNNLHLIYRREHEHNYDYTNINDELHNMSCLVPGCNFNAEEVHTYSHEINSTHTEHYDVCICGDVIYQTYDFYHMTDWDNSHLKICNLCGLSEIVRDYQCHAISEHYHEYYCDVCDIVITEEHKLIYEEVDDDRHIRRCIYCDYYEITFHNSWGNPLEYYWNPDKNYYDVYCILCGNHHTSNTNKEDE